MQKKNKADVQPILDPKSLVNEGFNIWQKRSVI